MFLKSTFKNQACWPMAIILALGMLKQKNFRFEGSVDYIASSRPAWNYISTLIN
jgi:hypothetical protein